MSWVIAGALMVLGLAPLAMAATARWLARMLGCPVYSLGAARCEALGPDWGAWLHSIAGLDGLWVISAPIALVGFAWGIVLALITLRRRWPQ